MNSSSPARALRDTLDRGIGFRPSAAPIGPSAWRDHAQKLNRSTVLGDQAVAEPERRLDVVDDLALGLRECVVGEPVGRAAGVVGAVLGELDA